MSEEPKLEPGSSDDETLAVLIPFLDVLRSASPFTLDPKTLYGAITHFLSTLPPPHLITFTAVLVASPSLWDPESNRQVHVRDAVRLAVPARVGVIDKELEDAYFSSIRRRRLARRWLNEVSQTVISSETSHGRNEVTVGLLEGLDDVQGLDWGSARVQIEEELVMTLASILEKDSGSSKEILRLLCAAMSHIAEERLHILDLQVGHVQFDIIIAYCCTDLVAADPGLAPEFAFADIRFFCVSNVSWRRDPCALASAWTNDHRARSWWSLDARLRLDGHAGLLLSHAIEVE